MEVSVTPTPKVSRPDTGTAPVTSPTQFHLHAVAATPFTGKEIHWRGLTPAYLEDPHDFILREFLQAAADGADLLILHRLSGMPDYRRGWPASHEFDPFREMDAAFFSNVIGGIIKGFDSTGVSPALYAGWLWDERGRNQEADWDEDHFRDKFARFCSMLARYGVFTLIHDTAGSGALRAELLSTLSTIAANHGVTYIPEGYSPEVVASGLPSFNRNGKDPAKPRPNVPWNQGKLFNADQPAICGIGGNTGKLESPIAVDAIADRGFPVWAWTKAARPLAHAAMESRYTHRIVHPNSPAMRQERIEQVANLEANKAKNPDATIASVTLKLKASENDRLGTSRYLLEAHRQLERNLAKVASFLQEIGLFKDAPAYSVEGGAGGTHPAAEAKEG